MRTRTPSADGPLPAVEEYSKLTVRDPRTWIPTQDKKSVTDAVSKAAGSTMVRLPSYFCEFNPIELVWARCNITYNLDTAMSIMRDACKAGDATY